MIVSRGAARRLRRDGGQRGISLVELLVAMSIMSVITAMLLMGWFSLSRSYGFAVHSADARDSGRQAMQRLQREVRDAQKPPQGYPGTSSSESESPDAPDAIIYRARSYWIAISTTFNDAGNAAAGWTGTPTPTPSPSRPHLVVYRLYADHELWRFEDLNDNGNGKIDMSNGGTFNMLLDSGFSVNEQRYGEGATLLVANVVNPVSSDPPTLDASALFHYSYYDSAGVLQSKPRLTGADRQAIIAVQLRLLVDLDPTKAPVFADLRGTAQLRNAR